MKFQIPRLWIIPMLCGAGLLCGYLSGRLAKSPGSPARPAAASRPVRAPDVTAALPSPRHSQDSAETLLTLDDPALYGRLALWLLDAAEPDISAFWQNYRQRKAPDSKIIHLVFIHWTRLNPQAAIAAAGNNDIQPWRAWASNDPESALAAVIAAGSKHIQAVMDAIAEFHPKWLRAHFDEFPDACKKAAISALRNSADPSDPMASLDFAQKCGDEEMVGSAFRALVTRDPLAAWDWIGLNPALAAQTFGSSRGAMEYLIQTIRRTQTKDLERIAALTPPGELKRKIEAKIFEQLVTTDPQAALAEAKATKAPRIAAQRLAEVSKSFIHSDPEKAFETAQVLFATCPGAADRPILITYPGCLRDTVDDDLSSETYQLLAGLSAKDPARTVEMILPGTPQPNESGTFSFLTNIWAERDLVSYTGWVNQQTDPRVREPAAWLIVSRLSTQQQYGEALDWAMTLSAPKNNRPGQIYQEWKESNPQEAQAWLKSANLPADRKALIEKGGSK
jgi:hypothetical protein